MELIRSRRRQLWRPGWNGRRSAPQSGGAWLWVRSDVLDAVWFPFEGSLQDGNQEQGHPPEGRVKSGAEPDQTVAPARPKCLRM